jgi:hypothetical protein
MQCLARCREHAATTLQQLKEKPHLADAAGQERLNICTLKEEKPCFGLEKTRISKVQIGLLGLLVISQNNSYSLHICHALV